MKDFTVIQKIYFVKMHGLGNDFVIINKNDLPANCDLSKLAINMANRHIGIGCDQFIIYEQLDNVNLNRDNLNIVEGFLGETKSSAAAYTNVREEQRQVSTTKAPTRLGYQMLIYNQDGSVAKLCGDASRCLAKLIYLNTGEKEVKLNVYGRELLCKVLADNEISVDAGIVSFKEDWMPSSDKIWQVAERYMIDLKEVIYADIGNPHFVIFSDLSDQDKEIIGEKLQEKELFADGVNVNFASIKNNKIYLSVWERGAGLTFACGSGACATFASALKLGFVNSPCEVVFKLGSLKMSKQGENIIMTGPATLVATGEFFYE